MQSTVTIDSVTYDHMSWATWDDGLVLTTNHGFRVRAGGFCDVLTGLVIESPGYEIMVFGQTGLGLICEWMPAVDGGIIRVWSLRDVSVSANEEFFRICLVRKVDRVLDQA